MGSVGGWSSSAKAQSEAESRMAAAIGNFIATSLLYTRRKWALLWYIANETAGQGEPYPYCAFRRGARRHRILLVHVPDAQRARAGAAAGRPDDGQRHVDPQVHQRRDQAAAGAAAAAQQHLRAAVGAGACGHPDVRVSPRR